MTISLLNTDFYKFTMALKPFDEEVFVLSHRKNGRLILPVNIPEFVDSLIPRVSDGQLEEEYQYLHQYSNLQHVSREMLESLRNPKYEIVYYCPKGMTVDPREPIVTMRGQSFFLSWLESLLEGSLSYLMQVATAAAQVSYLSEYDSFLASISNVTCQEQKRLTIEAINGIGCNIPESVITVSSDTYAENVRKNALNVVATGVLRNNVIEVGFRSATCPEQQLIALKALQEIGITKTSYVYGAKVLGMQAVGSMGHEGIQRYGGDDAKAFKAHIDKIQFVYMLLDTNDTIRIGIPEAIKKMKEYPDRRDGVRPDSGDIKAQFVEFDKELKENGLEHRPWLFEDGLTANDIREIELLRNDINYPAEKVCYALGGYFIGKPEMTGYTRDRIGLVYKLSWNELIGSTMKFGNDIECGDSGKMSIPGVPVVYVNSSGDKFVGQENEFGSDTIYGIKQSTQTEVKSRPTLSAHTLGIATYLTDQRQLKLSSYSAKGNIV